MHYDDTLDNIETHFSLDKALDKAIFKSNSTEVQPENLIDLQTESLFSPSAVVTLENNENKTKVMAIKNEFLQVHHWLDPFLNTSNQLNEIKTEPVDNKLTTKSTPIETTPIETTPIEITPTESTPIKKPAKQRKKYKRPSECKKYARFAIIKINEIVECDKCHKRLRKQHMPNHWKSHMNFKSIACPTCKQKFNLKKYLDRHILCVHSDKTKKYCCQYCSHRFHELCNLNQHIRIHTGENPFKCKICGKACNQSGMLKAHMRTHTQEKPYKCDYCSKQFSSTSSYWQHRRRHEKLTKFKCSTCGKEFVNKQDFNRHNMIHTGERPFSCTICNATFNKKYTYNQHLLKHTDEKPYKCRFCPLTFTVSHSRRLHERKVHNDIKRSEKISYAYNQHLLSTVEKPNKCRYDESNTEKIVNQNELLQQPVLNQFRNNSDCLKLNDITVKPAHNETTTTSMESPINQHTKYKRASRSKKYANFGIVRQNETAECDQCHKLLTRKQMPQHWRLHMNPKSFVCPTCKQGFNLKKYLDRHIRGVHSEKIKKYCCQYCSHRFYDYTNLKTHIRVHTGEKPYKCEFCGKGFNQASILKTHIHTHAQEKPYKCEYCNKQFCSTSSYTQHKRRHEGVTRFKCSTCDKEYFNKHDFKRHNMIHTGERPYSCNVCPATFNKKYTYNQHLLTHNVESDNVVYPFYFLQNQQNSFF